MGLVEAGRGCPHVLEMGYSSSELKEDSEDLCQMEYEAKTRKTLAWPSFDGLVRVRCSIKVNQHKDEDGEAQATLAGSFSFTRMLQIS